MIFEVYVRMEKAIREVMQFVQVLAQLAWDLSGCMLVRHVELLETAGLQQGGRDDLPRRREHSLPRELWCLDNVL